VDNVVYLASGQDPEHGDGPGHLYAIDATKRGDITQTGRSGNTTRSAARYRRVRCATASCTTRFSGSCTPWTPGPEALLVHDTLRGLGFALRG